MHSHTKFGNKRFISSRQTLIETANLCCDLDPEHSNQILDKTFWLMMINHQLSLVARESLVQKLTAVSVTTTQKIATEWFCTTPAHDDTPQYQVWFQKVETFRRYRPSKTRTQ